MKKKIFNNLWLKILSVVAAMVLWLVVVNINDAVSSRPFKNIKVNTINTDIITEQGQTYRVEEGTDTVDLVVYARRSVLDKLKSSDFVATADMKKDLQYGTVKIDVTYLGNYEIQKIEQSRTNVLVSIEESVTEQFKVSVDTDGSKPSDGLVVGSLVPQQTLIEITGPVSVVERIKRVEAKVNISGITGTTVRTCYLKLYNSDGDEIDNSSLEYVGKDTLFEVTVNLLNTKLVGISFDISQAAPEGYGVSAISYKPETVTIAGQRSQISGIYNLNIPPEALNPEGKTGKIEQTVDISQYLDSGIVIPDENDREIVVTMEITPYSTVNYVFSPEQIHFQNVPDGYAVDVSDSGTLEVPVSGLDQDLVGLTMDTVSLAIDFSEIRRVGTYTLPVEIGLPDTLRCQKELEFTVKLVRAEAE